MKGFGNKPVKPRQTGVGLVEIMISIAIGLTLLIALGYFFVSGRQMNRTGDDISRMQESGRYAMEIIGKAFRQAGYRLDVSQDLSQSAIEGPNANGIVTLRHDPMRVPHASSNRFGSEANCLGQVITSVDSPNGAGGVVNSALVEYIFSILPATRELRCGSRNAAGVVTSQVVAENIENMQVTYGVDADGDGIIDAYQTAVPANTATIVAARVSLLVRSPSPNVAAGPQTYFFNGQQIAANDGFLRQVYTSTFTLRNQAR